ncbi:hypothetical protein PAXRUDRAFT_18139 [Paxillus rubicundulus Ve08.2h10]|uniref:Unplaced genomic scaffold scaffold_2610, whole genome shotgun sequence n=1 Tax=Paxillus rubicundulus Ve08.2h10 TaxID=930991 RepID=A0A0D0D874_9AGAM|nr:hypothetical protein PAXRUDRAFT_18139 [Paxillus rubicundulus Ve08.2h10]
MRAQKEVEHWRAEEEARQKVEEEVKCKAEVEVQRRAEVLVVVVVEMQNMAMDRRHMAVESHAQMERMLGTLDFLQGCLDPEFTLEEGSEEDFEEEEVAEAAKEREALKGQSEEEAEPGPLPCVLTK